MNKNKIIHFYLNYWIPYIESKIKFNNKTHIIDYKGNKIRISEESSPSHWGIKLEPIGRDNILTKNFVILVWIRGENIMELENENPIGLKHVIKNITYGGIYEILFSILSKYF